MKIAVIGSGISGNVAAHHLNRDHDVTLFEANDYVGGHTHTHDIVWNGRHYAVDSGFIVFNERTYPHFIDLLGTLGVDSRPTEMSFSVRSERSGLEYNGHSINSLFAQRRNLLSPTFNRMILDILRFNRRAPRLLTQVGEEIPLGEYLESGGYSRAFIEHYIVPMGAAIWSTDPAKMLEFPARFFVRFFHHHGLLNVVDRPRWYVIPGGSRQYLKPLLQGLRGRIRLKSPIERVRRFPTHVEVRPRHGPPERFDAVFIAAHSDQALAMLADASGPEREVLGAIRYQENEAVLHTDERVLPRRRLAWAAWNYHLPTEPRERVTLTYNMNILQGLDAPVQFCVTLNSSSAIRAEKIIDRVTYHHPVFTRESIAAQQRQGEINGVNRTYFCGAYWRNGFHEDGVVSALNALKHFQEAGDEELRLRRAG